MTVLSEEILGPETAGGAVLPPEGPRENLIQTAIKFLQNPKVRQSDFAQRRTFLEKKGLTTEEIEIAIERSGTAGDINQVPVATATSQPVVQYGAPVQQPVIVAPPESAWSRLRDYVATIIVIGGVSYAVFKLYKKYIEPYLFGPSEEDKKLHSIQKSMMEIQQSLPEMMKTMKEIQTSIAQQHGNMQETATASGKLRESQYTNEVKEEIKSLKGLLLSRKQFPSAPSSNPVIPSWQLASSSTAEPVSDAAIPTKDNSTVSSHKVTFSTSDGKSTEMSEMPLGLESTPPMTALKTESESETTPVTMASEVAEPVSMATSDAESEDRQDVNASSELVQPQMNGDVHITADVNNDLQLDGQEQKVKDTDLQGVKVEETDSIEQPEQ